VRCGAQQGREVVMAEGGVREAPQRRRQPLQETAPEGNGAACLKNVPWNLVQKNLHPSRRDREYLPAVAGIIPAAVGGYRPCVPSERPPANRAAVSRHARVNQTAKARRLRSRRSL